MVVNRLPPQSFQSPGMWYIIVNGMNYWLGVFKQFTGFYLNSFKSNNQIILVLYPLFSHYAALSSQILENVPNWYSYFIFNFAWKNTKMMIHI